MRITTKGQVTIPAQIREQAGMLPHTEVDFILEGNEVRIVRKQSTGESRGDRLVRQLRTGRDDLTMSTDEIMALTRGD